MAKKSKTKGRGAELELAHLTEGDRTSRIGEASPDVTTGERFGSTLIEVKRRAKSFTTLYNALAQAREYGGEWVAVRDDRKEWLMVCSLDTWKREHERT